MTDKKCSFRCDLSFIKVSSKLLLILQLNHFFNRRKLRIDANL